MKKRCGERGLCEKKSLLNSLALRCFLSCILLCNLSAFLSFSFSSSFPFSFFLSSSLVCPHHARRRVWIDDWRERVPGAPAWLRCSIRRMARRLHAPPRAVHQRTTALGTPARPSCSRRCKKLEEKIRNSKKKRKGKITIVFFFFLQISRMMAARQAAGPGEATPADMCSRPLTLGLRWRRQAAQWPGPRDRQPRPWPTGGDSASFKRSSTFALRLSHGGKRKRKKIGPDGGGGSGARARNC